MEKEYIFTNTAQEKTTNKDGSQVLQRVLFAEYKGEIIKVIIPQDL